MTVSPVDGDSGDSGGDNLVSGPLGKRGTGQLTNGRSAERSTRGAREEHESRKTTGGTRQREHEDDKNRPRYLCPAGERDDMSVCARRKEVTMCSESCRYKSRPWAGQSRGLEGPRSPMAVEKWSAGALLSRRPLEPQR